MKPPRLSYSSRILRMALICVHEKEIEKKKNPKAVGAWMFNKKATANMAAYTFFPEAIQGTAVKLDYGPKKCFFQMK